MSIQTSENSALIAEALEIAQKRRETLEQMRAALKRGDDVEALKQARILCGLTDEKQGNRVN